MILAAGKRRHRITIETHNGNRVEGEPTYRVDSDWNKLMEGVPASYQDVTGGERVRGFQMEAETNGLLMILSTPRTRSLKSKMRVKMGTRVLNIVSVLDLAGDERELAIQVSEASP